MGDLVRLEVVTVVWMLVQAVGTIAGGVLAGSALLLAVGFLNPQQPEIVLEELMSVLRRARPTRREVELLLAAVAQLERSRVR